jgi:hypothetical protein
VILLCRSGSHVRRGSAQRRRRECHWSFRKPKDHGTRRISRRQSPHVSKAGAPTSPRYVPRCWRPAFLQTPNSRPPWTTSTEFVVGNVNDEWCRCRRRVGIISKAQRGYNRDRLDCRRIAHTRLRRPTTVIGVYVSITTFKCDPNSAQPESHYSIEPQAKRRRLALNK